MKWFLIACCAVGVSWASPIESPRILQPKEEMGDDLFEGDMDLTEEQKNSLFDGLVDIRTGLLNEKYRWPNKTLIYDFAEDVNTEQRDWIEKGLQNIASNTCLKFVRRTTEKGYVLVTTNSTGCSSNVGRRGDRQLLKLKNAKLGSGCFKFGTIIHEFIHALGFYHAQSAYNRDEYVTINWENIEPGHEHNFEIRDNKTTTMYDLEYDYGSVMHYSATSFSVNGKPTIVPAQDGVVIGQREKMSDLDIERIKRMYKC
ncbi:hypothetical protein DMENIID0001_085710 [Sergentomyia squamirostris]